MRKVIVLVGQVVGSWEVRAFLAKVTVWGKQLQPGLPHRPRRCKGSQKRRVSRSLRRNWPWSEISCLEKRPRQKATAHHKNSLDTTAQSGGVNGQCQSKFHLKAVFFPDSSMSVQHALGRGLEALASQRENGWHTSKPPPKVDWSLSDVKGFSFGPSSGNCQETLLEASIQVRGFQGCPLKKVGRESTLGVPNSCPY